MAARVKNRRVDRLPFMLGWAILFAGVSLPVEAQNPADHRPPSDSIHLISVRQGREIADVALQQDEPIRGSQDCSHLVHEIYMDAGYAYPYASSFELYAGNGNFRRVRHAQPGDLIAWHGHVGIVIDPHEHSFYSLTRSGARPADYLSPYWRSRGIPRFYRYVSLRHPTEQVELARSTRVGR